MLKFRRIAKQKYPWLFVYGCAPHALHNLCKDVIAKVDGEADTLKDAQKINRFWLEHSTAKQILAKTLTDSGKTILSPPLVGETRWGSSLRVLEFVLQSRREMLIALLDPLVEKIRGFPDTRKFRKIRQYVQQECPELPPGIKQEVLECIRKREEVAIDDCHCLATALHPRYGVTHLEASQTERAMAAMEVIADRLGVNIGDLYHDYGMFAVRHGPFRMEKAEAAIDHMAAAVWWSAFHCSSPLSKVASRVTSLVASVAAVDRIFKDHKRQQTHDRNRLDENKMGKLALITGIQRLQDMDSASVYEGEPDVGAAFERLQMEDIDDTWAPGSVNDDDEDSDENDDSTSSDSLDISSVYSEQM